MSDYRPAAVITPAPRGATPYPEVTGRYTATVQVAGPSPLWARDDSRREIARAKRALRSALLRAVKALENS